MMKEQLFNLTCFFAALMLFVACSDKDEVDKTAETLRQLAGSWLYTSEEDMQCYLITFYESGEFLYQSQEVDVKKTLSGRLTYSEEANTVTLMPTTGESPITFMLSGFDATGQQLSLVNSSGKALSFEKTMITQLPAHDNWKPWEPLNVNDKTYLEETAKEFMALFQANDFKNLTDIARSIKDYNTDELYTWQRECIESMTTLVSGSVVYDETYIDDERGYSWRDNDFEIRDYLYYYTDYKRLLRASAFKGHFTVKSGKWVYTQANDLQFTFNDRQGSQCVLKMTTSGASKTVYVGGNSDYDYLYSSYWYDGYGNRHDERVYEYYKTEGYLEIPEHASLTFTQGGQTLISVSADFDLSNIGGEMWNLSRNGLSSVVRAMVNNYDINAERISYSPTAESQVKLQLSKDGSLILAVDIEGGGYADISAEHGLHYFDTSTLDNAKVTIDLVGKIQIYANINDIHSIRRAIENANENHRKESDFKRYIDRANGLYNAHFRYAYEEEPYVRGNLTLEAFANSDYSGEYWEARPIITFTKDNTSYAIDSYFTENRFRTVTNTFWNLLDDFEDLGKSIGNGASWGDDEYFGASSLVVFNKDGGEKPIIVSCNNQWTLTDIPSWLRASRTSGTGYDTIRVTAGTYTGNEARVAKMYVKSGTQKMSVLVMQVPTIGGHQYDDPAAVIEGCYAYSDGFVSLKRVSANQVRLTYLYIKYVMEMTDPVDLTITQTPEGIIYLKGQDVEGSYYQTWMDRSLFLSFQDVNNTTLYLQKKDNAKGSGSLDDPFNAAAATALAEYAGYSESNDVYVKGKVASITENYGTQYGNATFKISDDGTDNNTFYIYRALYLGNVKYRNGDLLKVGDDVVIHGKVINYNGSIPETVQGKAYLHSLNGVSIPPETTLWEGAIGPTDWSGTVTIETTTDILSQLVVGRTMGIDFVCSTETDYWSMAICGHWWTGLEGPKIAYGTDDGGLGLMEFSQDATNFEWKLVQKDIDILTEQGAMLFVGNGVVIKRLYIR